MYQGTILKRKVHLTNRDRDSLLKRWDPKLVENAALCSNVRCPLCEKHYLTYERDCSTCPLNQFRTARDVGCVNVIYESIGEEKIRNVGYYSIDFTTKSNKIAQRYVQKIRDLILSLKKV